MPSLALNANIGQSDANSYVLIADVDAYALASLASDAWDNADDLKLIYVIRAARLLDSMVVYPGRPTDTIQRMQWPRVWVSHPSYGYYDVNIIPNAVKDAQCALAIYLATQATNTDDPFAGLDSVNLTRLSVGPISLDFKSALPAGMIYFNSVIVPILEAGNCIQEEGRLTR